MRPILIAVVLLFSFLNISAQQKLLIPEGTYPHLYLNHKVALKENFYSIGRMYNVSPREIAPFNQLDLEKGLTLGQNLKVPLTATNFSSTKNAQPTEALIPLYHIVRGRETFEQIGIHYYTTVANLKKYNKVTAIGNGTKLLIGYLKVSKELSPLAGGRLNTTHSDSTHTNPHAATQIADTSDIVIPHANTSIVTTNNTPVSFNGGVFKSDYTTEGRGRNEITENGTAGIFKSTSGWKDGKYYCFHNTAPQGTIVKITNPANGKTIYAKVLDVLPDMRQQTPVIIQLSNAAAEELGATDAKFSCTVTYHM